MSTVTTQKNAGSGQNRPLDRSLKGILFQRIAELGYSKGQVKDKLDVTYQALRDWDKGKHDPQPETYYAVCRLLRIDPETKKFVDTGSPNRSLDGLPSGALNNSPSSAPVYTMDVSSKEGRLLHAANEIGRVQAKHEGVYFVTVQTDGMEPTIPRGCMVPVELYSGNLASAIQDGIYIFRLEHSYRIKRLFIMPGQRVRVISDNERYPSIDLSIGDDTDFEVLGRVII